MRQRFCPFLFEKLFHWHLLNVSFSTDVCLLCHTWKMSFICGLVSMLYFLYQYLDIFVLVFSVQFSRSVMSGSLWPHESQHARPPCPSPTPGVHSDSRPLSRWCHPAISSSVILFSSCPQSLPASESFPMSQLFTWGGQSTGVSALASFLPKNTQDWSPLEWTGWISYILLKKNKKKKKQLALLYWRLRELLLNENRNTSLHGCNIVPKTRAILW